jgi:hypothetical protein
VTRQDKPGQVIYRPITLALRLPYFSVRETSEGDRETRLALLLTLDAIDGVRVIEEGSAGADKRGELLRASLAVGDARCAFRYFEPRMRPCIN